MGSIKERKVGEIFQDGNITLKVEEGNCCIDCFYKSKMGKCTAINSMISSCSPIDRSDNKNIIFKKEIMRDVILKVGIPGQKLLTVKVIKDALGLGLKEAKDLVDDIPSKIAGKVTDEKAEELVKAFEKEGMRIELRDFFTNKLVYPIRTVNDNIPSKADLVAEETVKILEDGKEVDKYLISEGKPHYWIMGTPDRGDDVYDLLHDKDPLLQLKINVSKEMIENPSRLLWINDNHEINAISVEDNVSLVNLITKSWTELKLPWKPEDKQLIWAWNDHVLYRRILTFYDSKNKCCFDGNGERDGNYYDNYAPFEGEWPQWAKNALEELED